MLKSVLALAIRLSRQLDFKTKFMLIFGASVLPGMVLLAFSMQDDIAAIDRDEAEMAGYQLVKSLNPLLQAISNHRTATAQVLNGDPSAQAAARAAAAEIDLQLSKFGNEHQHADAAQWQDKIDAYTQDWRRLAQNWSSMSASQNSLAHINVIAQVVEFKHHIAGDTGLLLDPDARAYYLVVTAIDNLPALTEQLQQLRGSLVSTIAQGKYDEKRVGRIEGSIQREIPRAIMRIDNDLELASDIDADVVAAVMSDWQPVVSGVTNLAKALGPTLASGQFDSAVLQSELQQLDKLLNDIATLQQQMGQSLETALTDRIAASWTSFYLMLALGLTILASVGWLIAGFARDITERSRHLQQDMAELSTGNFTTKIRDKGRDELAAVAQSAAALAKQLGDVMRDISDNAGELIGAASNIASTSTQIAGASAEQSRAATSMAAAMEQLTVSVSHMAQNAQHVREQTEASGRASEQGSQVIKNTVRSMQAIESTVRQASSSVTALGDNAKAISGIVDVIRGIAEQTNLLALNAAIEAARAGESGRGFAVVADEVRSLAARTASSTREISQMIERIQQGTALVVDNMQQGNQQVEQGVELASEAGIAIAGLSERSRAVEQMVQGMTVTLGEQSAAAGEVAMQVENIARMSNENTEATRVFAETSQDLRHVANRLNVQVSQFQF